MPPTPRESVHPFASLFLPAVFLIVITLAVYWPSMRGDFLWDDDVLLTANGNVQSADGLKAIWAGKDTADYFPVTLTTLWVEWRLFGMKPFGYHLVNTFLHAIAAVLLWRVLLQLKIRGAFIGAAVFAVHPVCVASVAWIAERKNTLSLVFFLLAALLYLKSEPTGPGSSRNPAPGSRKLYIAALCAFLLALLSKTSVVVLPPVLLGCAWWLRGKIQRSDLVRTAPFFAMALVLGLVTVFFQNKYAFTNSPDPMLVRVLGGGMAVWFYLFKAVVPTNLSMIYPRWDIQPSSIIAWLSWLISVLTVVACWRFREKWGRAALFAFGYFLITLFPVLGLFDMSFFAFSRVADHLAYLSLIAIAASAGAALSLTARRSGSFNAIAAIVISALAALTWTRAHAFASSEKLWTDTLKKNPKAWAAYNHLGEAMAWKGDIDRALELFQAAVQLNPKYAFAHFNLGNANMAKGRFSEAIPCFQKALEVWPDYAQAENGWGLALVELGKLDEAIIHFRTALKHAPRYVEAHYNLALALSQKRQLPEAIEHFRAALETDPRHVGARLDLAVALSEIGKVEDAAIAYQEVIRAAPDLPQAHNGLGLLMLKKNNFQVAEQSLREAVRLLPDDVILLSNLGEVLMKQHRYDEAITTLERATRLDPGNNHISLRLADARNAAAKQP